MPPKKTTEAKAKTSAKKPAAGSKKSTKANDPVESDEFEDEDHKEELATADSDSLEEGEEEVKKPAKGKKPTKKKPVESEEEEEEEYAPVKKPAAKGRKPKSSKTPEPGDEAPKEKKPSGLTKPMTMSAELAAIVGSSPDEKLARSEIVKRLWAYLKEKNLQDPDNKQFFTPDKLMQPVFGSEKIRAFSMSKYLKDHLS